MKKLRTRWGLDMLEKSLPSEQQKSIQKVKKKIALLIRSRKKVPMPKDKIVCETHRMAINELILESLPNDLTYYNNLKEYKKRLMENA